MIFKKKMGDSQKRAKKDKKKAKKATLAPDTILTDNSPFVVKEAYKALRSNIIFSLPAKGCKIIGITSAYSGEGKSTNCLNLAICFAQMGAKTIIIDADLRRPSLLTLLGEKKCDGLSNILVGLKEYKDVVKKDVYENLDVIFSGAVPPNPTELLINEGMKNLLDELSTEYEYIFIDCPPVNVVTDASIISKLCNGIILVAKNNETTKDDIVFAKEQLDFAEAKILGTVLNSVYVTGTKIGYGRNYKYYKQEASLRKYYNPIDDGEE